MEDEKKQLKTEEKGARIGSGSILAAARKKQKKTVEEIASELNLSLTQIKTIELDQSEGLPEPTYVRGYIRSYAKLLGLDAEIVLQSYLNPNWQKSSSLDDMPKGIANAEGRDNGGRSSLAKIIVFLLFVSGLAFLWYSGLLNDLIGLNGDTREAAVEQSAPIVAITDELSTENLSDDPVADPAVVTEPDETLIVEEEIISNNLTLTFTQTSWVDIRDSDDKRLAYKSYPAGEELNVSSNKRLNVFLGNAEGVSAVYNGNIFDMTSYREGVYAKFTLGEDQ